MWLFSLLEVVLEPLLVHGVLSCTKRPKRDILARCVHGGDTSGTEMVVSGKHVHHRHLLRSFHLSRVSVGCSSDDSGDQSECNGMCSA